MGATDIIDSLPLEPSLIVGRGVVVEVDDILLDVCISPATEPFRIFMGLTVKLVSNLVPLAWSLTILGEMVRNPPLEYLIRGQGLDNCDSDSHDSYLACLGFRVNQ